MSTTIMYSKWKLYQTMLYTTVLAMILNGSLLMVRCDEEGGLGALDGVNHCDIDCGENGKCKGTNQYIPGCIPANDSKKCEIFKCACEYGWLGNDCTIETETCEESITTLPGVEARQCFNGGKCESYEITDPPEMSGEMGMRCNCQSLPNDLTAYAGHQCEFPAEQVCVRGATHSTYAFCVNGGTCKDIVEVDEEHPLCDCKSGYGGRYCQYELKFDGNNFELSPIDEIEYVNLILSGIHGNETVVKPYSSNDGLSGGMKFFIVLIVSTLCSIICCQCIRRRRPSTRSSSKSTRTTESDLTPDAAWDSRCDDEEIISNVTHTKNEII